jgi:transcriptional regulator with XRE-family HTH domain
MWLDNLIELRAANGNPPYKHIAQKVNMPERTVTRIFSGETENPSVENLYKIVNALGGSLDDILAGTKVVIGRTNLAELEAEVERLTNELDLANAENAVLQDKAANLTAENDILRLKLEHKDELLALHNYYIKRGE